MTISFGQILAIAIADFRERSRRYSFWVFLVLIAYATYLFVPALDAPYTTVTLDKYRGVYNSAWIASQITLMSVVMLSLVGFYFVRGSIIREYRARTHELVSSSPLSNFGYLSGKALSNVFILLSMIATLAITSVIMQLVRAEDTTIKILQLLGPYLLVVTPLMVGIACLAVLFDSIKFLRGGIGNVIFFFLWIGLIVTGGVNTKHKVAVTDVFGISYLWGEMIEDCARINSDYVPWEGPHSLGFHFDKPEDRVPLNTFQWDGPDWSAEFLLGRIVLVAGSLVLIGLSAAAFSRFSEDSPKLTRALARFRKGAATSDQIEPESQLPLATITSTSLSRLESHSTGIRFKQILTAETKLALKGVSLWWYIIVAGVFVAGMLAPFTISHHYLLAVGWFWPLLIWSKFGCRERMFDTIQLIRPTPAGAWTQLWAQWLVGIAITLVVAGFIGLRAVLTGQFDIALHWLLGGIFIPTLAIACGLLTGGRKLFEVLYTLLWYVGPLNGIPYCDFTGAAAMNTKTSLVLWSAIVAMMILVMTTTRLVQLRQR